MFFYTLGWWTVGQTCRTLWRVKATGKTNVPKNGPAILASNHLSFLDHFLMGSVVRRPIFYISKAEHFERPIRRRLFKAWGVIPLKRGAGDQEAFDRSVDVLKEGNLFCIYPEGTRSLDGKLHKGHTGVARLHLLTGAPIIPVAMMGTFQALPKGRNLPRFNKCGVRFGKPLEFTRPGNRAEDRASLRRITDEIMQAIRAESGQDYVDAYQYNPEVKGHAGALDGGNGAKREAVSAKPKA